MPNTRRKYHINFNLLLDEETDEQLIRLATDLDLNKSQLCRAAIRQWHDMKFRRTAACADGQTCRCPHAHIYPPSVPSGDLTEGSYDAHP